MTNLLVFLAGSRLGRLLTVFVLGAAVAGLVMHRITAGRVSRAQAQRAQAAIDRTKEVLNAVRRMSAA